MKSSNRGACSKAESSPKAKMPVSGHDLGAMVNELTLETKSWQ